VPLDEFAMSPNRNVPPGAEDCFHKAFASTTVALAILEVQELRVVEANQSFFRLLARTPEALVGRSLAEWELTANPECQSKLQAALRSAAPLENQEVALRRPAGEIRTALWSVAPLKLGEQGCVLLTLVDITEQRSLELQLQQSQKMDAIGQIAAGVAHDFNNLLTVIIGHACLQLSRPGLESVTIQSLDQIKKASERAAGLTRQLLAFSRKQAAQLKPLDPGETVRNLEKMLRRLVGESNRIEFACAEPIPAILADESNFEQVLLNLVVNARDALPGGGTVRISLQAVKIEASATPQHPDARPGRFVQLSVQDDGVGMDSETLRRIFEPFFTTKPIGKGTGLGLSTVYGIIKQHGGWVEVESAIGRGATFRIYFPVTERAVLAAKPESVTPQPLPASTTVLVVEDEPQVREFICADLRNAGLKVLDAECGKSALRIWSAFGDDVNLLLVDMVLPNGLSGWSLARILRAQNPELRVVFISGYGVDVSSSTHRLSEETNFLPKPFGQGRLLQVIRRSLTRPAAPLVEDNQAEALHPAVG